LESLEDQTYAKAAYEVVVVDNGSDQPIHGLVDQYQQAVAVIESRQGSYAARNKGISLAKGDIIAFTDSDCIPEPDWIERGVAHLLNRPDCGLVAGRIKLFFRNPDRLSAVEVYEKIKGFNQRNKIERYHHGVTANIFTRRKVMDSIGYFDAAMKSGGDVEWSQRVYASGRDLIYAHDVCVAHPARYSLGELYAKTTRVVGGIYDWKGDDRYSFLKIIREWVKLGGKVLGLVKRFIQNRSPSEKLSTLRHKIQYILMVIFVGHVRIFERIRLWIGGMSRR
jgi:glycosyltransferase involved in cell wall biosynthesis